MLGIVKTCFVGAQPETGSCERVQRNSQTITDLLLGVFKCLIGNGLWLALVARLIEFAVQFPPILDDRLEEREHAGPDRQSLNPPTGFMPVACWPLRYSSEVSGSAKASKPPG